MEDDRTVAEIITEEFAHEFTADDFVVTNTDLAGYHPMQGQASGYTGRAYLAQDNTGRPVLKIELTGNWHAVAKQVVEQLTFYLGKTDNKQMFSDGTPVLTNYFLYADGGESLQVDNYFLKSYRVDRLFTENGSVNLLGSILWERLNEEDIAQNGLYVTTRWSWPREQ